jgi:hypothetical protein
MKYIKKFESLKYGEGEFVLVGSGIIVRIIKNRNFIEPTSFNNLRQYYIETLDKETGNFFHRHWINEDEIERKLNKKEIKFVKMATSKNKFNI